MWCAVAVAVQSSIVKIRSLKASRMQRSRGTAGSTIHSVLSPFGVAFSASSRRSHMAAAPQIIKSAAQNRAAQRSPFSEGAEGKR